MSAELKQSAKTDAPTLGIWRSIHIEGSLKSNDGSLLIKAVPWFIDDSIFSLSSLRSPSCVKEN